MAESSAQAALELRRLARELRGSAGSLRAAAEALAADPEPELLQRQRLLGVVADEAERLSSTITHLESFADLELRSASEAPPRSAAEIAELLRTAASQAGLVCAAATTVPAVELPSGAETIAATARSFFDELRRETSVGSCALSAEQVDRHLLLDVAWEPAPADLPRLLEWQGEALAGGAASPGLRSALRELDGEAWFNLDRDGRFAHLKLLVPLATRRELSAV